MTETYRDMLFSKELINQLQSSLAKEKSCEYSKEDAIIFLFNYAFNSLHRPIYLTDDQYSMSAEDKVKYAEKKFKETLLEYEIEEALADDFIKANKKFGIFPS